MTGKTVSSFIAMSVENDHKNVNQTINCLRLFLQEIIREKEFAEQKLELLFKLRDFQNILLKHFDLEEEGGFMDDVLISAPHMEQKVKELKSEHEWMRKAVEDVIQDIKRGDLAGKVVADIEKVFDKISKHENQERRMIQASFYREFGGPA